MNKTTVKEYLAESPIIAAVSDSASFREALKAPPKILFHQSLKLPCIQEQIDAAHAAGKLLFVHIDLAEGLGRDRTAIEYLAKCGADAIISTRGQCIRYAREAGLMTVQRFFMLDSQSLSGVRGMIANTMPDFLEIIPCVVAKVVKRFSEGDVPVVAGGLIETKAEVTEALRSGAIAISTSRSELWYI